MLILYTKNGCSYCEKVKRVFLEKSLTYEERNIENLDYLKELQDYGARTMPYLVDTTANVKMAESDDIIDYVSEYNF
ncbi:glutathione S-transferase N-terminal domain-containing protein [Candidatus Gracilibacteria bacterium]|nr:glutathione S-transferase N-terminal domain-containing protein [Candidatus Gracilibacteria bacterium]MCF7898873.1 glutathione S-transferase N-terminal domain-containing protein [Candidatus Paceibacterota bacterium]